LHPGRVGRCQVKTPLSYIDKGVFLLLNSTLFFYIC
jgi:hypothetical protein